MGKTTLAFLALAIFAATCVDAGCRHPTFPEEFLWSFKGRIPKMNCVKVIEPSDPKWKNGDNFLCHVREHGRICNTGIRWSYRGAIKNMRCSRVNEPSEPKGYHWGDNFLCVPKNSPYHFKFYNYRPKMTRNCVQMTEPSDPNTWKDNFLCLKDL
ncbi:uncharacterized protein [Clytia hemisphaerica]|uniref:Cnidarian restricted protein n=1 Tax=Clytia hemisphaerica TaxID=252671 RepID=A0A7M6DPX1_9CNID|eukprot:TCONS_00068690-protein